MAIIEEFIRHYCSHNSTMIWKQLTYHQTYSGIFDMLSAWNTVDKVNLINWWKGNFALAAPQLTKFAVRILTIPSSSAASERNWSAFSYIHDKK